MSNDKLEELISDIDTHTKVQEEYLTTSQDSSYYEYVATFGYGDADPKEIISNIETYADYEQSISREEIELAVSILSKMEKSDLFYMLDQYASIDYYQYYEDVDYVFSVALGECECDLPDDILDRLNALNNVDLQYVRKNIDEFLSPGNVLYINLSGSIAMTLDLESLVKDLVKTSKTKRSI